MPSPVPPVTYLGPALRVRCERVHAVRDALTRNHSAVIHPQRVWFGHVHRWALLRIPRGNRDVKPILATGIRRCIPHSPIGVRGPVLIDAELIKSFALKDLVFQHQSFALIISPHAKLLSGSPA